MEAGTLAKDLSSLEQQLETFRGCRHSEGESFGRMEERMAPVGIEVFPVEGYHPSELVPAIRRLAIRLGREQDGEKLVDELESLEGFLASRLEGLATEERLRGIMLTDSNELFCIATESGNAFLEYAGVGRA